MKQDPDGPPPAERGHPNRKDDEVMTMVTEWDRTAGSGARARRVGQVRAAPSGLSHLLDFLCPWRVGQERRLAAERLDDHILRDIGVARGTVDYEMQQPFWRELRDWRS